MSDPTSNEFVEAWRNAADAEVARALADLTAYEPAAVAVIQTEATRRGVDAITAVNDASVRRSLYLAPASAIIRFFLRHRYITAILVGVAYERAKTVISPILQSYVHTTADAVAINVASALVYLLIVGVLCLPLRTYRTVLATFAFFVLGSFGAGFPNIVRWISTLSQQRTISYAFFLFVSALLIAWAVPCLVLSIVVYLRNRYRPIYPPGHCGKCGYDLHGLPEPRCPECGKPFEPADAIP